MMEDAGNQRRLLVIGPEPPPLTGMEIATRALVEELCTAGIPHARIDTADPNDELGNRARWTSHNVLLALHHLAATTRKAMRRDIGAVYLPIAQGFPALVRDIGFIVIALAMRKAVIVHLHGGAFDDFYRAQRPGIRWLLRATIGRATLGIVLTESLRPALECVLPPKRIAVVSNGVDLVSGGNAVLERGGDDDEVRLLFLSSLYPSKGVHVFIEGFAKAWRLRPSLRAVVAGNWPRKDLEEQAILLACELGINDAITFTGPVSGSAKTRLFHSCEVFCLPSRLPEGQPLVIIEAMASGLPVVATAWRGIADTVIDGQTGLLLPEASAELLAEKVIYLVDNPVERQRLGAAGRARYERLFTQRAFGQRMISALEPFVVVPSQQRRLQRRLADGDA